YLDAQAAWQYLTETRGIAPARIILFGESLGGAVAAWLAAREKPGLLVLASVFTSVPDLAAEIYPFLPVRWLTRFHYNTLESLQSVTCPVFIAHSPQDEIIPFAQSQRLFQAASEPKQFLTLEGGHNIGFIFMQPAWIKSLGAFMDAHLLASP
ncbi:MAG: alpha/beta hydrolase, partial [Pseudomonadota bacterium]